MTPRQRRFCTAWRQGEAAKRTPLQTIRHCDIDHRPARPWIHRSPAHRTHPKPFSPRCDPRPHRVLLLIEHLPARRNDQIPVAHRRGVEEDLFPDVVRLRVGVPEGLVQLEDEVFCAG
jgi:hypothetical protein